MIGGKRPKNGTTQNFHETKLRNRKREEKKKTRGRKKKKKVKVREIYKHDERKGRLKKGGRKRTEKEGKVRKKRRKEENGNGAKTEE